jgi:purine-binding chemotaxis protein CheW
MSDAKRLCTFHLADLFLGVDVLEVQEVLRDPPMTRVPLADEPIRGLINLRGDIVTAVDLRRRFGFEPAEGIEDPMNVVVRIDEGGAVALLVDSIGEVLEVDSASFEPPPPTLKANLRGLVSGVHKLDGELLLVLDTAWAIHGRPPVTLAP